MGICSQVLINVQGIEQLYVPLPDGVERKGQWMMTPGESKKEQ